MSLTPLTLSISCLLFLIVSLSLCPLCHPLCPLSFSTPRLLLATLPSVHLSPEVNRSLVLVGLFPVLDIPPGSSLVAVERHQERSTHPALLFLPPCQTPNTNSRGGRCIVLLASSLIGICESQRSLLFVSLHKLHKLNYQTS